MGSVWLAVKMDTLENTVTTRALKDILAKAVPPFVHLIARPVDILMDIVAVLLVIQGSDALQRVSNHMEKTASIHAIHTVTTESVTDLTEVVGWVVRTVFMANGAIQILKCLNKIHRHRSIGLLG